MKHILTVSEVNGYIRQIFARDLILGGLWVKGEISNYKNHSSGHMYFTLKDDKALIRCVMFRSANSGLKFKPSDGMKVVIRGNISVFERDGQYQLYAEEMLPEGMGELYLAFEQLKVRLHDEGLFDTAHKKPLPYLPRAIGVITSPTGAVLRDIVKVLGRRFAEMELKIYPVAVQGEQAPGQIANAIAAFNRLHCVDVIILARGGGSLEELWAFNEEQVAWSIFRSQIPIISAVGHETDYTIADFVADLRAPTPSAAAEMVVPEKLALQSKLVSLDIRMKNAMQRLLHTKKQEMDRLKGSTAFRQPLDRIYQERMRMDQLSRYLQKAVRGNLENTQSRFACCAGKLDALSPLTVLSRGYSVVRNVENGEIIRSTTQVTAGEPLEITVSDGKLYCRVNKVEMRAEYEETKTEL